MNFVNLAHGSLYMMGAYFAAAVFNATGSFVLAAIVAVPATMLLGIVVERVALIRLYRRDHLDQVLATFGLILFFNELVRIIWGPASVYMNTPDGAVGHRSSLFGLRYPAYRFAIIGVGLAVGLGPVRAHPSHAHRHADPRRRHASGDRGGARRQRAAAQHAGVRPRRGARGARRIDGGARSSRCSRAWASRS